MTPATRIVTARPGRARLAVTALFLANGSGGGAWVASLPEQHRRLALTDGQLGLALLAFAAGAMVAMPVAGWIAARHGPARVALAVGLAYAGCLVLPGQAAGLVPLAGTALLLGACSGAMDVAMNAQASIVERAWRAPIMSSVHAAFSLGGLLGASAMGGLLAAGLTVRSALVISALWSATLVGLALIGGINRAVPPAPAPALPGFAWPTPALLGIGALAFFALLLEGAVGDWSGVFLATVAGATTAAAASGYAAFSVAMVAGRVLGDRIVLRLGRARVLRVGAILAASGFALAVAAASPVAATAGFVLVGLGVANVVPVLFAAAGTTGAVAPSVGVAMAATFGYCGLLVGPPIIGFIADGIGLRLALLVLPAIAAVIALAAPAVLDRRATLMRSPA